MNLVGSQSRLRAVPHARRLLEELIKCALGVLFGSLGSEVMPMGEWRTVYILSRKRAVYALFAGERVSAGLFSQNRCATATPAAATADTRKPLRFIMIDSGKCESQFPLFAT